jgi:hypothetical protein
VSRCNKKESERSILTVVVFQNYLFGMYNLENSLRFAQEAYEEGLITILQQKEFYAVTRNSGS